MTKIASTTITKLTRCRRRNEDERRETKKKQMMMMMGDDDDDDDEYESNRVGEKKKGLGCGRGVVWNPAVLFPLIA